MPMDPLQESSKIEQIIFKWKKKKTHTKSTTYLDKFGLTIKISSEEDNFSLIVTKTLWIVIHSHLAIKGENCHSTKLRE